MNRKVNLLLREKLGEWIVITSGFIPGIIFAGFMPEADILPSAGWLAIATIGGSIGGAVATPRTSRGSLSGSLAGMGMMISIMLYVVIRSRLTESREFHILEIVFVSLLGALPGWLLYKNWAAVLRPYRR